MDDSSKTYRILRLIVSGFMRLKALDITPKRNVNKIAGMNRQGKSSTLKAIQAAIGGAKCFPIQPVKQGEEQAEILCILGDERPELLVKRIIQDNGKTALEITSAEGYKAPSPQAILDSLYGKLAFDPQRFLLLDDKQQQEMLRQLVGLDFTELDQERKQLYSERTQANKDAKSYAAQANGIVVPEDTPEAEVSVVALMAEQKRRQSHNATNQAERAKLDNLADDVKRTTNAIGIIESELARIQTKLEEANAHLTQQTLLYDAQQATIAVLENADVDAVQKQIIDAQTVNANVAKAKRKIELARQRDSAELLARDLTAKIEAIDAEKVKLLADVKWPVEGLAFGESGVLYNGLPFSQASDAEAAEVSFAMSAAMNPRLKVALVRNASLLDEEQLEVYCKMAEKLDMQVFLETVGEESGPATVIIEDGLVAEGGTPPEVAAPVPETPPSSEEVPPWEDGPLEGHGQLPFPE